MVGVTNTLVSFQNPVSPVGATQICRVFEAADLTTRRANQFLLFLDGKADNPIPVFLKVQEAKPCCIG